MLKEQIKKIIYGIIALLGLLFAFGGLTEIEKQHWGAGIFFVVLGLILITPFIKIYDFHKHKKEIDKLNNQKTDILLELDQKKQRTLEDLESQKSKLISETEEIKKELEKAQDSLRKYENELTIAYVDNRDYSDINSAQLKNELAKLDLKIKEMIKNSEATYIKTDYNKKKQNALERQILKVFNSDIESVLSKLSYANVDTTRGRILRAYESSNKIFKDDSIEITQEYLDLRLEELNLLYQYQVKLFNEKEQQKAIREQMVEEEKVRREIEREKKKIEKEEVRFRNEQNKLMQYLSKTDNDIERNLYLEKIKELEEKLKLLEKDKYNVLEREANTRAGYVYIISNIGSFGEGVYKIGLTRRLEPMDRIKELGSASVPFEFDVHAMIFSSDAPNLESELHKHFRDREVNKVNHRKEFFRVGLKEIENIVKEHHNATVEFTEVAKAAQYRESLRLSESK